MRKGQRLIMVRCSGEKGFVPNALLMFKSSKSGDYRDDMNHKNYMKWVEKKLLPNLEEHSVFVVDNASYHNVEVDRVPTSGSRKADMRKWLHQRGILFAKKETRFELYKKMKVHKPIRKKYILDRVMAQHGHSVLRLPPYHPELNPIEKGVKSYVASHNVTFKFSDMRKLAEKIPNNRRRRMEGCLQACPKS
jgi:transposase